jgi:hypothetical protein
MEALPGLLASRRLVVSMEKSAVARGNGSPDGE